MFCWSTSNVWGISGLFAGACKQQIVYSFN